MTWRLEMVDEGSASECAEGMREGHKAPAISVIIPSYNSADRIRACLDALVEQDLQAPFEVIVSDSSDDGTAGVLAAREGITVVRSPERLYPGTSRNRGVERARGSVLCFTDADCVPPPDWLKRIWGARPDLAKTAVGGALSNGTPRSSVGTAEYFSEFSEFLPGCPKRTARFIPTANLAIGAGEFAVTGGFRDYEKGSDVTFGHDCMERGIPVIFNPGITVAHVNRTDLKSFLSNQRRLGRGAGNNRVLHRLKGSWLAGFPPAWLMVPAARFSRIAFRSLRYGSGQRGSLMKSIHLLALGALYYGAGFAEGALAGRAKLKSDRASTQAR